MIPKKIELALTLLGVFAASASVIWIRTLNVKATYEFVRQEKELKNIQNEVQSLRVAWVKQTTPSKLDHIASNIGLAAPRLDQTLRYSTAKAK